MAGDQGRRSPRRRPVRRRVRPRQSSSAMRRKMQRSASTIVENLEQHGSNAGLQLVM